MNISQTKQEGQQTELKITIPSATIEQHIEEQLAKLINNQPLRGFRNGKISVQAKQAKMQAMRSRMATTLHNNAVEEQVRKGIEEVIKDYRLYGSPTISDLVVEPGQDASFSLSFARMPEINTPDWQAVSIEKPVVTFTEEEKQAQLQKEQKAAATFEDKGEDGVAENTDLLLLELESVIVGTEEVSLKPAINTYYQGTGIHVIFKDQEQFLNKRVNEALVVNSIIPEEINLYGEQYTMLFPYIGQSIGIKARVKTIKKMIVPEQTDPKFLAKIGCEGVAEISQKMEEKLSNQIAQETYTLLKIRLFNQLEGLLHYDLPKSLLDRETANLQHYFKDSEQSEGDTSFVADPNLIDKLANRRARLALFISHYADQESIKVSESDVRAKIIAEAQKAPWMSKEIVQFYQSNQAAVSQLISQLTEDKVVEHILQKIKITEVPITMAMFESAMDTEATVQ